MANPLREWKRWLFLLAVLALLGVGLFIRHMYEFAQTPVSRGEEATIMVPNGASYQAVVDRLIDEGWLAPDQRLEMKVLGRFLGVAGRIHAGEYRIAPGHTPLRILDRLAGGQVVQHTVTWPEGWTVAGILTRLAAQEGLATQDLPNGPEDPRLLAALGLKDEGYTSAEGWLFPDTYSFTRGDKAETLLRRSAERMSSILTSAWNERKADLPLDSAYEALILASIVEKETSVPAERAKIAGVFINRLREGMRLQADPTVIYGLGDGFDGDLLHRHLAEETPYNTYRIDGLPPTPIANPGKGAIQAACQPAETDARYFVARDDGTHVFSETLAEHNRAVRRHQKGGS